MATAPKDFNVYVTQTRENTFLAATNEAPFFCVEADTEEAAVEKAKAALGFYLRNRNSPARAKTDVPVRRFVPRRVIGSGELVPVG